MSISTVIAILIACCVSVAFAGGEAAGSDERGAALAWATENRAAAVESVFPAAGDAPVVMPICRVTTLRASGSIDTFEYFLRITEPCPEIDPRTNRVSGGNIRAEFAIPDRSPVTDQLADLRLHEPTITIARAIAALKIQRHQLDRDAALKLRDELSTISLSVLPPTDIILDTPTYELASSTGLAKRKLQVTEAGRSKGDRSVVQLARRVAKTFGYDDHRLRYDATFWNSSSTESRSRGSSTTPNSAKCSVTRTLAPSRSGSRGECTIRIRGR